MEITCLREEVRSSGVAQARIARLAGIHPSALCRMLAGKRRLSTDRIARIRRATAQLVAAERAAIAARERALQELIA